MTGEFHDDDEQDVPEVEIAFELLPDALERHGVSEDELHEALIAAIDERELALDRGESPPEIEEMELSVRGSTYRCSDFFEVTVSSESLDEDGE